MQHILSCEEFLFEKRINLSIENIIFTDEQIKESLYYLDCDDPKLLEAWYNTVLDFAGLIPGIGSIAEGINLLLYAKQGRYLLAGLCGIGVIPLFGQYIGAGGSLLVKILAKGGNIGKNILKPLINLVSKFFPKITAFFKSSKFAEKFKGISPYITKILAALKNFVINGGKRLSLYAKNPEKIRALGKERLYLKQGTKLIGSVFSRSKSSDKKISVPKDAYLTYQGKIPDNIKPYTNNEITNSENSDDWSKYLELI